MPPPPFIELGRGRDRVRLDILHEDRAALALDKPPGWMLVPFTWQRTGRNLQAALQSSIGAGDFWARSRRLRFLRYVHRLDADTSGVLLFGKSPGAVESLGALFESRAMSKRYLAVVAGRPAADEWTCRLSLEKDPADVTRMRVDAGGKDAETSFRILVERRDSVLVEARPLTGRTHQIRVHLAAEGLPVVGDVLYGRPAREGLGLRAVELAYDCPFTGRPVCVLAPEQEFRRRFGFATGPAAAFPTVAKKRGRPETGRPRSQAGRVTPWAAPRH